MPKIDIEGWSNWLFGKPHVLVRTLSVASDRNLNQTGLNKADICWLTWLESMGVALVSAKICLCWLSNDVIRIWFHSSSFGFVFLLPLPSERPFVKVGEMATSSSVCICHLSNFIGEVKGPWLSLIGEFCHIPIPIKNGQAKFRCLPPLPCDCVCVCV